MKHFECMAMGLAVVLAGWTCSAQETPTPLERLHRDGQLQAYRSDIAPDRIPASSVPAASSYAGSLMHSWPSPAIARPDHSTSYFLLNGLQLGMALADVETTQHCIANHQCKEGNPLMPSSQAGQISVGLGITAYAAASSYWLKKHKARVWWMPPVVGVVAHTVGVASGLRYR